MWKLNNTFLNNQWIKFKKSKRKSRKYLETNENVWDAAKAVPRGRFIVINDYIEKKDLKKIA